MTDLSQPGSAQPAPRRAGSRSAIRRSLQTEGYAVLEAQNGAIALEFVLTDLRMPEMDGRQLAAALARLRPRLPIIFMSGVTAQLMDMRLVSPQLVFRAKPFRNEDLLATIRNQLGASEHRPRQRSRTDPKGSEV